MNSTITLDGTVFEVIDLDGSEDGVANARENRSEVCETNDAPELSQPDDEKIEEMVIHGDDSERTCSTPKNTISENETLDSKPLVKVIFRDGSVSRKFGSRIKQFIKELISQKNDTPTESEAGSEELVLEVWESDAISTEATIDVTESEDSQDINCDSLFMVDTQPSCKDDLDVPTYGKKYENAFEKSKAGEESDSEKRGPKIVCFNCMGNHKLQECREPRNRDNIKKNRKNINKTGAPKGARYHLDQDQKFGHMVPGQLSGLLRSALGISRNDLPVHIYRMRTLGYPPGWLEEARLQHSGLALFNSDGQPDNDPSAEPGEKFDEGDRDQYDIKKIFDFPGFNVPPPPGTHDDSKSHWTPQMQSAHSKQTMLMMLRGKKADEGYRRKKMKTTNAMPMDNSNITPSNMDIEDLEDSAVECMPVNGEFVPPLPPSSSKQDDPPPPPPSSSTEETECPPQTVQSPESPDDSSPSSRANSPSLSDLENMKNRLLVELEDSSSQSNSEAPSKNCPNVEKLEMPPPSNTTTPEVNRSRSAQNTPSSNQGNTKSVDLGTPVLQSNSPYNKLPSSEKFSKNICDVINFENLPDSTGKYEQMTGVLQKVRNTLAKLHEET